MNTYKTLPLQLQPERFLGGLVSDPAETPIENATWYVAHEVDDGLAYRFERGALATARYLTADLLLDGKFLAVFVLKLQEGEDGAVFNLTFGALNQCSARLRMPLEAVNQNRWRYEREGAWLKPTCYGERVDLSRVDRMTLTVHRKSLEPVRWCLTPLVATLEEPPRLEELVLPKGVLLDELGQSTLHDWSGKSRSHEEVTARLKEQSEAAPEQGWPEGFSRWGGLKERQLEATGSFRTHHDGRRWWLVDPDGHPFWSSGQDCVRVDTPAAYSGLEQALTWLPERDGSYADAHRYGEGKQASVNYLAANLIRAFGDSWFERWAALALAELRHLGFNTVANWSEWQIAKAAGFPYVRPLHPTFPNTPLVFRDFPDVFHPTFVADAETFAEVLRDTADDPAFIGYFLMNEPTWGFATQAPAEGMLLNTPACEGRRALANFLQERYGDEQKLQQAWGEGVTLAEVTEGAWHHPLNDAARADLELFSTVMVERLFGGLSAACRKVDPNHLNLGARYYTVPPDWAVAGMGSFDVFSVNNYREKVDRERLEPLSETLGCPIMVGEWHFGAHDVGLPASGIGHVKDQRARGQAYRVYLEDAAAQPWCVGAHYFTLYDQSALGRFDGENYNIGFLDVCHRPYEELAAAARESHRRLYSVASGTLEPYSDAPDYLPKLFS